MIECFVTGLLAWRDGQPGQVGNEAATAVFHQCRGSGSSPSSFCLSCFSPLAFADIASASDAGSLCFVRSLRKRARGVLAVGRWPLPRGGGRTLCTTHATRTD